MKYDYYQPDFYRFSEDSIQLARLAANESFKNKRISCLDLGAGSGVVGIETAILRQDINYLELLEYQKEFQPFLLKNIELIPNCKSNVVFQKFSNYVSSTKFNLIVGNLPYFDGESSRIGPNNNKSICRHFVIDNINDVMRVLIQSLDEDGRALLLLHEDQLKKMQTTLRTKVLWKMNQVSIIHFSK